MTKKRTPVSHKIVVYNVFVSTFKSSKESDSCKIHPSLYSNCAIFAVDTHLRGIIINTATVAACNVHDHSVTITSPFYNHTDWSNMI